MSYIKDIRIKDFAITAINGDSMGVGFHLRDGKPVEGSGISGIVRFDYFESIFNPNVAASIVLTATSQMVTDLPIRGTEKVEFTLTHPSGEPIEFKEELGTHWVIDGVEEPSTSSTQEMILLRLTTPENVKQELVNNRLTLRYDPSIAINVHVEGILSNLGTLKEFDIEKTANSYGFYGNYWRPFKAIYWLAKRATATGGGDRAGFLFWETKSGYHFKSIDTIAATAKESVVQTFKQKESAAENEDSNDYNIFNPFVEHNQNIVGQLRKKGYGHNTKYFNPYEMPQTFQPEETIKLSQTFEKSDSFGTDDYDKKDLGVGDNPTSVDVQPYVSGTMTQDGTVDPASDSGDPQKWGIQSNIKYQQILSQSHRITVPMNFDLEAGLPINLELIAPNTGLDSSESGVYLIKDLRHAISFEQGTAECTTHMRCIRDNYGNDGINTNITLLNS